MTENHRDDDSPSDPAEMPIGAHDLGNGAYELLAADGSKSARCEDGDRVYVEPYVYVCRNGHWVREGGPIK